MCNDFIKNILICIKIILLDWWLENNLPPQQAVWLSNIQIYLTTSI